MARIDARATGPIVDAKRGHRPVKLIHPHTGPVAAPQANEATARKHQRAAARANARQRFAAAFADARERVKKAAG